jgi:hypothetical protein
MPINHQKRPQAGHGLEDRIARILKIRGMDVEQVARNERFDMRVNGRKVDVKSAIETSYKGSDGYPIKGYVFTNLHPEPTADYYVLVCLSRDRKKIKEVYVVPTRKFKQGTLTLTSSMREKLAPYKGAWEQLKTASFLAPNVYRRNDPIPINRRDEKEKKKKRDGAMTTRSLKHQVPLAVLGTVAGYYAPSALKKIQHGNKYVEQDGDFGSIIGAATGMVVGLQAGKHLERTRRRHDRDYWAAPDTTE